MKYDIIDNQTGEYYEENITLAEARDTAIRLFERGIDEQAGASEEDKQDDLQLLERIRQDDSFDKIAQTLWIFDYELRERSIPMGKLKDKIIDYMENGQYCDSEVVDMYEELAEWLLDSAKQLKGE